MSEDLTSVWKITVNILTKHLIEHNATVARQIDIAMDQLITAGSAEEFQQIGIIMRDAWIEFSQSIFRKEFLPTGVNSISSADAKRLVQYSLKKVKSNTEYLIELSKTAFNLCNKVEHDLNATQEMALQCIISSVMCMGLIQKTMINSDLLISRPYYRCPSCGSLKLETKEHWEPDIEGAFKVDKLTCTECGWFYIEEMGGMSGVGEDT